MSTTDVFTSSSTWTCPAYVTTVWARCWGGGGSGGGITATPSSTLVGGGGAGGAFAEVLAVSVVPGTTYTVTVGATRTGSTGSGAAGNDTWFINNTTVLAKGGAGGTSPAVDGASGIGGAGTTTGSIGDNTFAGGSGANGLSGNTSTFVGAGGGGAGSGAPGNPGSGTSGGGGGSSLGGSGGNGRTTAGAGNAGSTYGGGGSGAMGSTASHSFAGGNGAPGRVELEYTPTFTSSGTGIRAASDASVDVNLAPAIIDSLTPVSGDVFLLLGGTTLIPGASGNSMGGLWSWSSAGAAMNLVLDSDGSYRDVREGTHAGARCFTSSAAFSGGTPVASGNVYFINPLDPMTVVAGKPGAVGYVGVLPAVALSGSCTVAHNLGSKFLLVTIAATASPYALVTIGPGNWVVERTDENTLTVKPPAAISAGAYEICIAKAV